MPSSGAESRAPARYQTRNDRSSQPWAAPHAIVAVAAASESTPPAQA